LPTPRLDHSAFRQIWAQDLIPADHRLLVLAHDLLHALVEVRLQFLITLDFAFTHELLYFRICIPLLSVYLVAPDMEVLVGKKLGHFTDELVEELVGFVWVGSIAGSKTPHLRSI